jgi:hypothetical protein
MQIDYEDEDEDEDERNTVLAVRRCPGLAGVTPLEA